MGNKPKKRIVLGEGYPGKAVLCTMYLLKDPKKNCVTNLIPLTSFRSLWDKKIRLIAEVINDK